MTAKELFDQIVTDIQLNNDVNYMPSLDYLGDGLTALATSPSGHVV